MNFLSLWFCLAGLKAYIGARGERYRLFLHFQLDNTLQKAPRQILQKQIIKAVSEGATVIAGSLCLCTDYFERDTI